MIRSPSPSSALEVITKGLRATQVHFRTLRQHTGPDSCFRGILPIEASLASFTRPSRGCVDFNGVERNPCSVLRDEAFGLFTGSNVCVHSWISTEILERLKITISLVCRYRAPCGTAASDVFNVPRVVQPILESRELQEDLCKDRTYCGEAGGHNTETWFCRRPYCNHTIGP